MAGYYQPMPDAREHPWLLRFDDFGDTLWTANNLTPMYPLSQSDPGNGYCWSAVEAIDGYFYATSQVSDSSSATYFLTKIDPVGDTIWTKEFDWGLGPELLRLTAGLDSSLILYGRYYNSITPIFSADVLMVKTDLNGDTLWTRKYPLANSVTSPQSVVVTSDSGYFISAAAVNNTTLDVDYYLIRTDKNGDTLWTRTSGDIGCAKGGPGIQYSDGSFIVSGLTACQTSGMTDLYLAKFDSTGNLVWERNYGGVNDDRANAIIETTDGGFIACGYTQSYGFGNGDVYIVKTDSNGIAPTGFLTTAAPENYFKLFPNPSSGRVFIEYRIPQDEDGILEVYSMTGVLLIRETLTAGTERSEFDWSELEPGMYLTRVIVNEVPMKTERMIITE